MLPKLCPLLLCHPNVSSMKSGSFIPLIFCKLVYSMFLDLLLWRRQWHPTPVLLPGQSHGWRSLVGCGPWGLLRVGHDWASSLSLSWIGEGNGNPLQCYCLENRRDGGAWSAAVYGVTQSWTWLKWLSSSRTVVEWINLCSGIFAVWTSNNNNSF